MNRRQRGALVLAIWLLGATARPARASGHVVSGLDAYAPLLVLLVIVGAAIPSELGTATNDDLSAGRFDLGWAYQIPTHWDRHRIIGGVDHVFMPIGEVPRWRGRIGYRYDRRYLIAGLAASIDSDGFGWSPEVGIKFLHFKDPPPPTSHPEVPTDPSLHLLVRANLAPALDRFRGVTVLLGWSIF